MIGGPNEPEVTLSVGGCYSLRSAAGEGFAHQRVGKLVPMILHRADPVTCTRLDCFDQSLRRTDRLLLDLGSALELMTSDGGRVTQSIPRRAKFVVDLPDGPVKLALADMSPLRRLLPSGSVRLDRSTLAFVDDDQKIRCHALVQILTASDGQSVTLVKLSGLRGYDKALADMRRHLETSGATDFSMSALYDLLFPTRTDYTAKPHLVLTADQSAYDAATTIIASHIPVARRNEAGIIADLDTEFLHDFRVALRKIRSVLSLFKGVYQPATTDDLKARFSAVMALTGPLRDQDVQRLEQPMFYDLLPDSLHGGLDAMFALHETQRAAALVKLARHLSTKRYAQDMMELARVFDTPGLVEPGLLEPGLLEPGPQADKPVQSYAFSLIWKRFQKSRQIADAMGPETPDTEVHSLRIHCKKLRYLMEFSASLVPEASFKAAIKPMKLLQDHLGVFNDRSVQLLNLQTFLARSGTWPDSSKLQIAQSIGALTVVMHQRKQDERLKIQSIISGFTSNQTQQIFRDLFHARKPKS